MTVYGYQSMLHRVQEYHKRTSAGSYRSCDRWDKPLTWCKCSPISLLPASLKIHRRGSIRTRNGSVGEFSDSSWWAEAVLGNLARIARQTVRRIESSRQTPSLPSSEQVHICLKASPSLVLSPPFAK